MIDQQLKKIFPSLVIHHSIKQNLDEEYEWYLSKENKLIGIQKNDLTNKEIELLSTFLEPYTNTFPISTKQEKIWEERIYQGSHKTLEPHIQYRFVYFSISNNQIDPKSFKEALHELFNKTISVIWVNQQEGMIIEEQPQEMVEKISYEQIIDILMSDLYVKINFLVGPFQQDLQQVNKHYQNILKTARVAFSYTEKHVISYVQAIPYILMHKADSIFKQELTNTILKEFSNDHELLQTIEAFLDSNLNISVTAKKLYMHRNSLQYRLDKFNESTGIDVRDFHQALTVYLALLATK